MKKFLEPVIEIESFSAEDIITVSATVTEPEGPPPMGGMIDPMSCIS